MPYISISPSETDSGSDIVDSVMTRIRDNWLSCCAGESGAPRFKTSAVESPVAGWQWSLTESFSGTTSGWWSITTLTHVNGTVLHRWQAWRTGSYRFWIAMNRTFTSQQAHAQVYRNGAAYSPVYSIAVGAVNANHIFDLNFSAGDQIDIYVFAPQLCRFDVLGGCVANAFAYVG